MRRCPEIEQRYHIAVMYRRVWAATVQSTGSDKRNLREHVLSALNYLCSSRNANNVVSFVRKALLMAWQRCRLVPFVYLGLVIIMILQVRVPGVSSF